MKRFFLKPFRWAAVFSLLLIGSFTYVLLDTFVIPQSLEAATTVLASENADTSGVIAEFDASAQTSSEATITDNSYEDENIKISIETLQKYDSTIYVADIQVSDVSYLQTALANDTYGKNIKETTSDIASSHNAIFAVNGDYYGFRNSGYVLRNGNLYRDTADSSGDTEALVIDENGDFSIISERETAVSSLNTEDVWQIFSFGPALIESGSLSCQANDNNYING